MRSLPAFALALAACSSATYGEGTVSGSLGDATFGDELTVYHGTRHVVVVNTHIDCLDMAWVTRNYFSADARSDVEFGAVQFTWGGDEEVIEEGTFSLVAGDGAVTAWSLVNLNLPETGDPPPMEFDRSRDGTLTVDSSTEDAVIGAFSVNFGDEDVTGNFTSVFCRNVR